MLVHQPDRNGKLWVVNRQGSKPRNDTPLNFNGSPHHGEGCSNAKLTETKVLDIRNKVFTGRASVKAMATKHQITYSGVLSIIHGKTWKHVGGPIIAPKPRKRFIGKLRRVS